MSPRDPTGIRDPFPILYVDDEESNRIIFQATFEDEFEIVLAASGAEALAILDRQPIDVLLTDNRMPLMSGVELCERVRTAYPDVQRLIMTAYTDRESVMQAINQGRVAGYLVKPWKLEEVRSALAESQAIAHRARLAREIQSAMLLRTRSEVQARVLHDLANVTSSVASSCDELELMLPEIQAAVTGELGERMGEELTLLRRAVDFIRSLHTGVRGLNRDAEDVQVPHGVEHLLHGAVAVARGQFPPRTQVVIDCPGELEVLADRTDVGRILVNLLVNAGHALAEAAVPNPRVTLHARSEGAQVHIRVADNGPGVPPALQQRIFDARFTTRASHGGTGLGLAISRRLAEDNGGSIELDPEASGAAFDLRLLGRQAESPAGVPEAVIVPGAILGISD
jgi:signal transduction histidine kinase